MSEANQLHDDLQFVRNAVERRDRTASSPAAINYVWAVYVLVGYTLIDLRPEISGWFFMAGGIIGGLLSFYLGKRASRKVGDHDHELVRRIMLHWFAGMLLAIASAIALASIIPALRGQAGGQLIVVMIGLVYFLGGVHFQRYLLILGPVLIIGGLLVGYVPRYGWTALGAVIALGLVIPTFFPQPAGTAPAASAVNPRP
jgi:hypothetical protein